MINREKIGWAVATLAGILALWQANPWHELGWVSPHKHESDVNDFRLEWRCDEDTEELDELLEKPTRTAKELQRVTELADDIDENDCRRF